MIGQVVEVVESDRRLSLEYGSMVVKSGNRILGRVPLDDIQALLMNPHGSTVSIGLLAALAERGTPVVIAGPNFKPVATLVPLVGHHAISRRIEAQVEATLPARKQAWKQVVRSKITMQALVLEHWGHDATAMWELEASVRSGDPSNCEAQAARLYWRRHLGAAFRRDPDEPGVNALLNYGYAVIRAATARAITAAGLHPSIGIHHRGPLDTMRLADDLMEPFRPLIDARVRGLADAGEPGDVVPRTKKMLVNTLSTDVPTRAGTSPLSVAIHRSAHSLAQYLLGERKDLELPGVDYRPRITDFAEAYV